MIGYTNYTNTGSAFMRGYERGDPLVRGYSGEIATSMFDHLLDPTDAILERIFALHNRDDRPDGRLCPSMSVGDVVILGETAWTVLPSGWERVDLDLRDLITDRTWTEVVR